MSRREELLKGTYARVLKQCDSLEAKIDKHLPSVERDDEQVEKFIKLLELKMQKNQPITSAEIRVLTVYLRKAILGHAISLSAISILNSQVAILALSANQKIDLTLEVPKNVEKQLILWTERMEAAQEAQGQYVR